MPCIKSGHETSELKLMVVFHSLMTFSVPGSSFINPLLSYLCQWSRGTQPVHTKPSYLLQSPAALWLLEKEPSSYTSNRFAQCVPCPSPVYSPHLKIPFVHCTNPALEILSYKCSHILHMHQLNLY